MGLDIILGGLVLIAAIRGWFRGFVLQAIRLGGLVACVYEAGPLRDLARPHAQVYLTGLRPELLDRLLWWTGCALGYVTTVGVATLLVRLYRRQAEGERESYRGDQAAGLLLGAAKGLLVAAFLVAGIDRYALKPLAQVDWTADQLQKSKALAWARAHRPADRIWEAPPVQAFVAHVQAMGLNAPSGADLDGSDAGPEANPATARAQSPTAGQADALRMPRPASPKPPPTLELDPELQEVLRSLQDPEAGD